MPAVSSKEVDVIASTTLSVAPDTPLDYHWMGLKLHVPAYAMEPEAANLTLRIQALDGNHIQLPENMVLVSGVYSVTFPQRFTLPVGMEVQHCAHLEHPHQLSSLTFVTAKSTQGMPNYQFQMLSGGIFPDKTWYGSIQLSHSSEVAIVHDGSKMYTALTYYVPQSATSWLVHIIIIWDLDLYLQVCII